MNLENDDDNESEDDSLNPSTPSPTNQTEDGGDELSERSTSEPLKKRTTSKRKQAEEEYHLIKNLSQSIANKHKRKQNNTISEAFGNYVAQALSELDKVASHLAQNKINNIIFQAQGWITNPGNANTGNDATPVPEKLLPPNYATWYVEKPSTSHLCAK